MASITRVAATSHFLLMFGYKLFSFFFPLYLAQQGFSLPQVGYTYLLIYLPIALASPVAGLIARRIRPTWLAVAGIFGYSLYSLTMYASPTPGIFFVMQVVLGVSAALFFASLRTILFASRPALPDTSFGWFYAAPRYAEVTAPAVGAGLIWAFGFPGVFLASTTIQIVNMFYALANLPMSHPARQKTKLDTTWSRYRELWQGLRAPGLAPLMIVTATILLMDGLYFPYQILFLQNIGWTRESILVYGVLINLVFIPLSFYLIRWLGRQSSRRNILRGAGVYGLGSVAFGALAARLNLAGVVGILLVKGLGGLVSSAGRSGLLARRFSHLPQELGVFDTVLSPLGIAGGALLGSLLVTRLDFGSLFIQAGVLVMSLAIIVSFYQKAFRI